jgi:hypothetical protein
VIAVYLHSQIQQHSDNSISGSTHECDSAPFDPAYWKDDGLLGRQVLLTGALIDLDE